MLPDIELAWLVAQDRGEASQDYASEFDRIEPLKFSAAAFGIDESMRQKLRDLSKERRKGSQEFQKHAEAMEQYLAWKKRGTINLSAQRFPADYTGRQTDFVRIREVEDAAAVVRDYYLNEAIAITLDYLRQLPADRGGLKKSQP